MIDVITKPRPRESGVWVLIWITNP